MCCACGNCNIILIYVTFMHTYSHTHTNTHEICCPGFLHCNCQTVNSGTQICINLVKLIHKPHLRSLLIVEISLLPQATFWTQVLTNLYGSVLGTWNSWKLLYEINYMQQSVETLFRQNRYLKLSQVAFFFPCKKSVEKWNWNHLPSLLK